MKKGANKIAAVLAMPMKGKAKGGGEVPEAEGSSPDMDEEYGSSSVTVDAAQALLDAQASGDAEAFAKAFKDMLAVCME